MFANLVTPRRPRTLAAVVALVWLAIAVPLLGDHGPGWDSTMGDLPFGERLVAYLETRDSAFLDNTAIAPVPRRPDEHLFLDGPRFPSAMVYPLGALACGVTSRVFDTELGWLDSIAGFHLAIVVFAALTLALVAHFGALRIAPIVGVLAALFLAAQPRWVAHAFNNPKDLPETALYFATIVAGFTAIERGGARRWVFVGALAGLALAQKANIVFAAPQLLVLWAWCAWRGAAAPTTVLRASGHVALALACAFAACTLASPDAWAQPFGRLFERLSATADAGRLAGAEAHTISVAALRNFAAATPTTLLALAIIGALAGRAPTHVRLFLVLGVVVPVGRTLLPGMRVFDGVRHFLEFTPFLALLAALGAWTLVERWCALAPVRLRAALALVCAAPGLVSSVALHPNQCVYYAPIVGGLAGAQERGWSGAGDYWGNSYLQAAHWLSQHAESDAYVVASIAGHVLDAVRPVALRSDIRPIDGLAPPVEGVVYVLVLSRLEHPPPFVAAVNEHVPLVHSIRAQGGSVLDVRRLVLGPSNAHILELHRAERVHRRPVEALLHFFAREPAIAMEFHQRWEAEPDRPLHEHVASLRERVPAHLVPAVEALVEHLAALRAQSQPGQ